MNELIRNAIQTPDGTILESRNRHDYTTYVDANGKQYMVDGGLDYQKRSAQGDEIDRCVFDDDPHEEVREACSWGTYGINGDQPLTYVKLKDMSTDHIQACIDTQRTMYPQIKTAMKNELKYRSSK